jgi:hypothetical protein
LLLQVKKHILDEPLRLYMRRFEVHNNGNVVLRDRNGVRRLFPKCGTAACIGGWGAILSRLPGDEWDRDYRALFGLTENESYRLFNPDMWPKQFREGVFDDGSRNTAEVCANRIDFFIKTKGTDDERSIVTES